VIRVFPRKTKWTPTDDLAFVGDPPLLRPPDQRVHISVTFTWDLCEGQRLLDAWRRYYPDVRIGGPVLTGPDDYPDEFVPGRYIKPGVTFTSRGCPKSCPWCLARRREGLLQELPVYPGYIIQDNNFLACSQAHCEEVYAMLAEQTGVAFKGGLDIDYLTPWHVDRIKALPSVDELWVACDAKWQLPRMDKAAGLLADFSIEKRFCYALIGFGDDTPDKATARCEAILAKGFLPFVQYYRPPDIALWERGVVPWSPAEWTEVIRKWSRPAFYRAKPKPLETPLWKT